MNIDGTQKTQLTNRLGYDGGAFFNMDATKIVWRVYHPESDNEIADYLALLDQNLIRPMALQIWTMNADGTEKKQVTKNKSANFGHYFFPDGNRMIISSNFDNLGKGASGAAIQCMNIVFDFPETISLVI